MNNKLYIIAVLCFSFFSIEAQMVVNINPPNNDPVYLVEQVLLGNGVTASNIVFSGELEQIGYFDGSASNIGMTSGIVMCTVYYSLIRSFFLALTSFPITSIIYIPEARFLMFIVVLLLTIPFITTLPLVSSNLN